MAGTSVLGNLVIKIMADVSGVAEALEDTRTKLDRAGGAMKSAGMAATAGITAPLAGAALGAIKFGQDFASGMANIASLGVASERVTQLKTDVQDMAIATGKSTSDLSGGLYQVISAFGDTADTANILKINAIAAGAGLSTTSEAIALTSSVTKGYGDTSATAVQSVADLALRTVQLGQTTFPELAASMGRVVPVAASMNVSQQELFATMATLSGVTGTASEVSTQLRGVIQSMMAPTGDMANLITSLGYSSGAAMLQQEGLQGTIAKVVAAAEATGQPLQKFISSIEGQTAALALTGPQAETFKQKLAEMGNASGTTQQAFEAQTQGINATGFQMEQTRIKMEVMFQKIYDGLVPALAKAVEAAQPLIDGIVNLANKFGDLNPKTQTIIVAIAAVAAAIGPVLMVVGTLLPLLGTLATVVGVVGTVIGAIVSPIGLVVVAIVALIAAIVLIIKHWDDIKEAAGRIWENVRAAVVGKVDEIKAAISKWLTETWEKISSFDLKEAARKAFETVVSGVKEKAVDGLKAAAKWLDDTLVKIENFNLKPAASTFFGTTLPGIGEKITEALSKVGTWIADTAKKIYEGTLKPAASTFFGTTLPGIGEKATAALSTVGTWLTDTGTKIKNFNLKQAASTFFGTTLPGIAEKATAALSTVGTWLTDVGKKISEHSFKSETLRAFATIIGGIVEKAGEILTSVGTFLADILTTIQSFSLVDAGRALIQGLIDGVGQMKDVLLDAVGRLVEEAISWIKNMLGIKSPSTVFFQIGIDLIQGLVNGIRGMSAEALQAMASVLGGVAGIIDALSKVSGFKPIADLKQRLQAMVVQIQEVVTTLSQLYWWSRNLGWLAEHVAETMQAVGTIAGGLKTMAESLEAVAKYKTAAGLKDGIMGLITAIQEAVTQLAKVDFPGLKEVVTKAGEVAYVAQALAAIADAWTVIGQVKITPGAGAVIDWLVSVAKAIGLAVTALEASGKLKFPDTFKVFCDNLVAAFAPLTAAAEFAKQVADLSLGKVKDLPERMAAFAGLMGALVSQIVEVAKHFSAKGLDAAKAFAETVKPVTDMVSGGVEALRALAAFAIERGGNLPANMAAFAGLIGALVAHIAEVGKHFGEKGLAAAKAFAEATGPVSDMISGGIEALTALAKFGLAKTQDLPAKMGMFADLMGALVSQIATVGRHFGDKGLAAAKAFAEATGPVSDMISGGIEALTALAKFGLPKAQDLPERMAAFAGLMGALVEQVKQAGLQFSNKGLAAAKAFAEAVKPVTDMVAGGLEALAALAAAKFGSAAVLTANMQDFTVAMAAFASVLGFAAQQISDKAEAAAAAFAKVIGDIVAPVTTGVEALGTLAGADFGDIEAVKVKMQDYTANMATFAAILGYAAQTIAEKCKAQAAAFALVIKDIVTPVKTGIEALSALAEADFGDWETIKVKMWDFAANMVTFTAILGYAAQTISGKAIDAARAFAGVATDLKDTVTALQEALTAVSTDGLDAAKGFEQASGEMVSAIVAGMEAALGLADGSMGLTVVMQRIVQSVVYAVQQVEQAWAELVGAGYAFGSNWVDAIIDGMTSRLSNLETLLAYIRGLFPSSPARYGPWRDLPDAKGVGLGFASSLASGLDAGVGMVAAAAGRLMPGMNGDEPGAGNSGGAVTVNISGPFYVREESDIQRIAEAVGRVLAGQTQTAGRMNIGWARAGV